MYFNVLQKRLTDIGLKFRVRYLLPSGSNITVQYSIYFIFQWVTFYGGDPNSVFLEEFTNLRTETVQHLLVLWFLVDWKYFNYSTSYNAFFLHQRKLAKKKFEIQNFKYFILGPPNGLNVFDLDKGKINLDEFLFIFSI